MFGSSQDRARQLAGRNRRERISSISSCSSSRSVSSSSRVPPLRNRLSTLDSPIQSPSAIKEHAACDENGTTLDPHALEGPNQHLVEERLSVSALQLASGQGGSQIEHHRRQAEHLSQVLYSGFALIPSATPPPSQFSSPHQTRHSSVGSQPDTALRLLDITASDPSSHLTDSLLLNLPDSFNAITGFSRDAFITKHDPTSLTTVSLRGGSGGIPLPDPHSFNDPEDYVAWVRHLSKRSWGLDFDISGAYHQTFLQERQQFLTEDICAEYESLDQIPNYENILLTSGDEYVAFRCTLSRRKLSHFDSLFGPPFPKTATATNYHTCLAFFHCLDAEQKQRFYDMVYMSMRRLRKLVAMTVQQPPVTLALLGDTIIEYYGNAHGPNPAASSSATKSALNTLFNNYVEAGAQDKDIVGVEGTMQYFTEVEVDAEGLDALVALEIVQAPTIGEMSREGFVNGWSERNCDTVDKQKRYIKTLKRDMPGNKDLFTRVYKYTFPIAKTAGQKAVALEVALVYWDLLFSSPLSAVKWSSSNTPWLTWWSEFLTESYKKSVNKDMWNETLKFAQLTLEDEAMSFWTEESSWPSVIDDFVDWVKKEKRGDVPEEVMDEEY